MPPSRRGRSHTRWRDSPTAGDAGPHCACPRPPAAPAAATARERQRLRRVPRCALIATVPALRCAPRRGHLGDGCAAVARTCARSTRPVRTRALPRKAHAAILLPTGPGGPAGAWRAYTILAGEGCAGRFATDRGVDRRSLRSVSRTAPGSGCPLRPQVRTSGRRVVRGVRRSGTAGVRPRSRQARPGRRTGEPSGRR